MAESPDIGLFRESWRLVAEATGGVVDDVADIWRHEGLKKGVEAGLHLISQRQLGQWALEQMVCFGGDSGLSTTVGGMELSGPTGIAPGWDKTGKTIVAWQALGANHITVGGVTLFPQQGKHMPRLRTMDSRIGDHGTKVSLNAFGFPGLGADKTAYNIAKQRELGVKIPVIVQATANKEFYEPSNIDLLPGIMAATVRKILPVADAIGLGLSSPNTIGMRDAQAYDFLYEIVSRVRDEIESSGQEVPIIFKGDGDGGEERLDMYARLATALGIEVFELINTTGLVKIKSKYDVENLPGGLAGADEDYQQLAVDSVRYMYEAVGDKTDIIGVGGINGPERGLRMVRAGASAISINTFVRTAGTRAVKLIEKGMSDSLSSNPSGSDRIAQIIGIDTNRGPKAEAA